MKTNRKFLISFVTIVTFLVCRYIKYFYAYWIFGAGQWNAMDLEYKILLLNYSQIFLVLVITALLFKDLPFKYLGLKKDFLKGLMYAFVFSLPMFIGYGYRAGFVTNLSLSDIHMNMVMAGFFEELLFRGFLFGLLFYYAGWGFLPAVLLPSIFFGLAHLYQAENFSDSIGIFIFTSLASAGFALFYVSWKSLWMVIFLHGFMDLAWDMFAIETNVTGDLYANIFRFSTLGLAIFFSAKRMKMHNPLKGNWWRNRAIPG